MTDRGFKIRLTLTTALYCFGQKAALYPSLLLLIPEINSIALKKTAQVSSGLMSAHSRLALGYQEPASQSKQKAHLKKAVSSNLTFVVFSGITSFRSNPPHSVDPWFLVPYTDLRQCIYHTVPRVTVISVSTTKLGPSKTKTRSGHVGDPSIQHMGPNTKRVAIHRCTQTNESPGHQKDRYPWRAWTA